MNVKNIKGLLNLSATCAVLFPVVLTVPVITSAASLTVTDTDTDFVRI